ncbi:PadR family transcriptional regulator [Nocardiopsis composta]
MRVIGRSDPRPGAGAAPRHRRAGLPGAAGGAAVRLRPPGDAERGRCRRRRQHPLPLLRRLEKQGLLTSEWNTDDPRPRKFYRVSTEGARVRAGLVREWQDIVASIARVTKEN